MINKTILIVDDVLENIDVLKGILEDSYNILATKNPLNIFKIISKNKPDMILLDIMMPQISGYDICKQLKSDPNTSDIPIIFVTAKNDIGDEEYGLNLGAVDYITKPVNYAIVKARVKTHIDLYCYRQELEKKVYERTKEIEYTRLEVIRRLGRAAEYKDNETGLHVIRMSHYSKLIAQAINAEDTKWINLIYNVAAMHDIGKIGIPDHILKKNGPLNKEEWSIMKQHPLYGAKIIGEEDCELLALAKEIALSHHEKFDGSGYPHGLKGKDIPLSGRIIAVADVFDALTTQRPYKEAWSIEDSIQYLKDNSGTHFDPEIVAIFLNLMDKIIEIKNLYDE